MTSFIDFSATSKRWRRYSETYQVEARQHFSEIIKSSMAVATFLIGFNVIWLQLTSETGAILEVKAAFVLSLLSLVSSIILGIYTLLGANNYLNDVSEDFENRVTRLNEYILKSGESQGKNFPDDIDKSYIKNQYLPWHFWGQLACLAEGILFTLFSGLMILFPNIL